MRLHRDSLTFEFNGAHQVGHEGADEHSREFVAGALSTEQRSEGGTHLGVVVRHAPGRQQEDGRAMRDTRRPSRRGLAADSHARLQQH